MLNTRKEEIERGIQRNNVWCHKYFHEGTALINPSDGRGKGKRTAGKTASSRQLHELKAKIQDMHLRLDIFVEKIDVLKNRHKQDSVRQISTTGIAQKI